MDIAALSIDMHSTQLMQAVQTSVMKKAMDSEEAQATALIEDMLPPPSNHIIDTYA